MEGIRCLSTSGKCSSNYAYFPILVEKDYPFSRDLLYRNLKVQNIHPRRYFYPLISDFPMYRGLPSAHVDNLPVASRIAKQVLCLPMYPALLDTDLNRVTRVIAERDFAKA